MWHCYSIQHFSIMCCLLSSTFLQDGHGQLLLELVLVLATLSLTASMTLSEWKACTSNQLRYYDTIEQHSLVVAVYVVGCDY